MPIKPAWRPINWEDVYCNIILIRLSLVTLFDVRALRIDWNKDFSSLVSDSPIYEAVRCMWMFVSSIG